jgi:hypothetical protein
LSVAYPHAWADRNHPCCEQLFKDPYFQQIGKSNKAKQSLFLVIIRQ